MNQNFLNDKCNFFPNHISYVGRTVVHNNQSIIPVKNFVESNWAEVEKPTTFGHVREPMNFSADHTHAHTHTYIYIYIYVCVCVCMCVYACIGNQIILFFAIVMSRIPYDNTLTKTCDGNVIPEQNS